MDAELRLGTQPPGFTLSMANQTLAHPERRPLPARKPLNFCFLTACPLWLGCTLALLQAIYAPSPAVPGTCHVCLSTRPPTVLSCCADPRVRLDILGKTSGPSCQVHPG